MIFLTDLQPKDTNCTHGISVLEAMYMQSITVVSLRKKESASVGAKLVV